MSENYKVFISYHRRDSNKMRELKRIIDKSNRVSTYVVSDNLDLNDMSHQSISALINRIMDNCNIALFITGVETYSRVHVEHELNNALRGGIGNRKGIVVVLLDERGDNPNRLQRDSLSNRIYENSNYIVISSEKDFKSKYLKQFSISLQNSLNNHLNVINNQTLPEFRLRRYFEN